MGAGGGCTEFSLWVDVFFFIWLWVIMVVGEFVPANFFHHIFIVKLFFGGAKLKKQQPQEKKKKNRS